MKKWKPNKAEAEEFKKKMNEIDNFCNENGISSSLSKDSYYFVLNGQNFRVSNHTVESRVEWGRGVEGFLELVPKETAKREPDTIYITASKTRIIEIYNNLKNGKKLDKRGKIIE